MAYTKAYPNRINWQNTPSVNTPLNATNLNKLDSAVFEIDNTLYDWDNSKANKTDVTALSTRVSTLESGKANKSELSETNQRVTNLESTKANQSDILTDIKDVSYNANTGLWTFTRQNGSVITFDQNVEKIPVAFTMSPQGVITMRTADGTTYTADVGALIKTIDFVDTSTIDFTVTSTNGNKTVRAEIRAGSITERELSPDYLAVIHNSLNAAAASASDSAESALDSEAYAVGTRNGRNVTGSDIAYNNNSKYYSEISRSHSTSAYSSASTANTKANEAASSANTASTKATEAATSAANANTSATNAATSATQASQYANTAASKASEANQSATAVNSIRFDSEAYAKGTRNGAAVTSTDPAYHNNSKYFADQASSSATNASQSATTASNKANEAGQYASTASTKASEASASATTATNKASDVARSVNLAQTYASNANQSALSAKNSATTASNKATEASDSLEATKAIRYLSEAWAVGTKNGAPVPSTDVTYQNNSKYYAQQSQSSANQANEAKNTSQSIQQDVTLKYNQTEQLKNETEQLFNDTEETINNIVADVFSGISPSVYIDVNDGHLYYQGGSFYMIVDEDENSPTFGHLLWEVRV